MDEQQKVTLTVSPNPALSDDVARVLSAPTWRMSLFRLKGMRTMRAADCPICGQHFEAEDDDALVKQGRTHVDEKHPEQQITDEQIRQVPTRDA